MIKHCKYSFFQSKFEEYDLNLVDIPPAASLRQIAANSKDYYFYVELPNGKRLFHNATKKSGQKFPIHIARYNLNHKLFDGYFIYTLNYVREVLASPKLLNVQDRIDWRKCLQTLDEEKSDIQTFRSNFERFNPIKD